MSEQSEAVTAAVVVIGDGVLSGRTRDTNSGHIAETLTRLGVDLREIRVVPDEQPAIVEALSWWFELVWERATVVSELDLGEPRKDLRTHLLRQLAAGAKDEQIARSLDLSLRTVRRRVADLMNDLGADSRFQAGVEAARRGWI